MTAQATSARQPAVLIIDDAATVRMFHRALVEAADWSVTEAENGIEALERAMDTPVDQILVDVNMPVMDGYRFIEAARATEALEQTTGNTAHLDALFRAEQTVKGASGLFETRPSPRPSMPAKTCWTPSAWAS
ncbi:MAG: two-component system response regulator [Rhodobacteraceae bacterium]|nr:two-component system response regulator [Paracoccaceae bacterium]